VSHLGGIDEALTLAIERLERLHEVGERSRLVGATRLLVDRQDLFELVLLLAYTYVRQHRGTVKTCGFAG